MNRTKNKEKLNGLRFFFQSHLSFRIHFHPLFFLEGGELSGEAAVFAWVSHPCITSISSALSPPLYSMPPFVALAHLNSFLKEWKMDKTSKFVSFRLATSSFLILCELTETIETKEGWTVTRYRSVLSALLCSFLSVFYFEIIHCLSHPHPVLSFPFSLWVV